MTLFYPQMLGGVCLLGLPQTSVPTFPWFCKATEPWLSPGCARNLPAA